MTTQNNLSWLNNKLKWATIIPTCFSLASFIFFVTVFQLLSNWGFLISFIIGSVFAYLIDLQIITHGKHGLPNPFVWVPTGNKPPMSEQEVIAFLKPYWRNFPKKVYIVASIPYTILLILLMIEFGQLGFSTLPALRALFFGFVTNIFLVDSIFFAFMVVSMYKAFNS